eukprot:858450-Pelagomonas_calceolata.AAC.6
MHLQLQPAGGSVRHQQHAQGFELEWSVLTSCCSLFLCMPAHVSEGMQGRIVRQAAASRTQTRSVSPVYWHMCVRSSSIMERAVPDLAKGSVRTRGRAPRRADLAPITEGSTSLLQLSCPYRQSRKEEKGAPVKAARTLPTLMKEEETCVAEKK